MLQINSVFLFSCSVMSDSLPPHGLQHTTFPLPPLFPRVCAANERRTVAVRDASERTRKWRRVGRPPWRLTLSLYCPVISYLATKRVSHKYAYPHHLQLSPPSCSWLLVGTESTPAPSSQLTPSPPLLPAWQLITRACKVAVSDSL